MDLSMLKFYFGSELCFQSKSLNCLHSSRLKSNQKVHRRVLFSAPSAKGHPVHGIRPELPQNNSHGMTVVCQSATPPQLPQTPNCLQSARLCHWLAILRISHSEQKCNALIEHLLVRCLPKSTVAICFCVSISQLFQVLVCSNLKQ